MLPFEVLVSLSPRVEVRVVPTEPPRVVRHCPRCHVDRPFGSTDGFRVNAQKRRLDVWLIRRCEGCGSTWNQPVHERVGVAELGDRLDAYLRSDPERAFAVAYDEAALRRHGRVVPAEFRVDAPPAIPPFAADLRLERPFTVRIDRVLRQALSLSGRQLRAALEAGRIVVPGGVDRDLADGTPVWIGGPGVCAAAG